MNKSHIIDSLKNYGEPKILPSSISQKNISMRNVLSLVLHSYSFLILGHSYSDIDCISSMLSVSLLLKKFGKEVSIYLSEPFPSNVSFFRDICEYNEIFLFIASTEELEPPDVICIIDSPKPEMVAMDDKILQFFLKRSIPKIEIDHHFSSDARYSGDAPYRLTLRASSSAEIVAQICKKLSFHTRVLEKHGIAEIFSRNIVMTMVAGMMADAKKGEYLSKKRDVAFFNYFLNKFDHILQISHYKNSKNLSSVEEVFSILEKMTDEEVFFYKLIAAKAKYNDNIALLILDEKNSQILQQKIMSFPLFIDILRYTTGKLSESPNLASISAFYYPASISSFVEFRIRANETLRGIDFRPIIEKMEVPDGNGGGHAGAICFKVERSLIPNLDKYIESLFLNVQLLIEEHNRIIEIDQSGQND